MTSISMPVADKDIVITHADRMLFPEAGIRKADLARYYDRIAATLIPYIQERPLTMERYPDGLSEQGFYQKEAPEHFPDWIERISVPLLKDGSTQQQLVCGTQPALVYLVNQGCITPHVWLSRRDRLNYPDRLIFDLDPPNGQFDEVKFVAVALHELLQKLDLAAHVMTTGSSGLHVLVPLDRSHDFDEVRRFAQAVAERLAHSYPEKITVEQRKAKRGSRVYIDTLRNSYGQTSVAPYSVRARLGAPVAMPLAWSELDRPDLSARSYRIDNTFRRLGQIGDRWHGKLQSGQSLTGKLDELHAL